MLNFFDNFLGIESDINTYLGLLNDLNNMSKKSSGVEKEENTINVDKDCIIEDVNFELVEDTKLLSD